MNWCQFKDPVSHMCLAGASILVSNTGVGRFESFKWQIFLSLNALKTCRKINVSRFVTYQSYLVTRINAHSHGWPVQKLSFFCRMVWVLSLYATRNLLATQISFKNDLFYISMSGVSKRVPQRSALCIGRRTARCWEWSSFAAYYW